MITIENIRVFNFDGAIMGMRNPMNSWDKSDSYPDPLNLIEPYHIGENDLDLMRRLYKAGTEHRKYARQIFVSMDIIAPLYWWKEFDTYKVGTTSNSCSTMHKIHAKPFEPIDFSNEHLLEDKDMWGVFNTILAGLNVSREKFLKTKNKQYWWHMIQLLPSSYNQKRTITMTYENVFSIIHQRSGHKLDEWQDLCKKLKALPYIKEIMDE